jgi:hypothetical protein
LAVAHFVGCGSLYYLSPGAYAPRLYAVGRLRRLKAKVLKHKTLHNLVYRSSFKDASSYAKGSSSIRAKADVDELTNWKVHC